jgi:hypothetical protein
MSYLTSSYVNPQSGNCFTGSFYWPEGGTGVRAQITNAYFQIFGRYGESFGLEQYWDQWVNQDAQSIYGSIYNMVYQGGIDSGEVPFVNTYGKYRNFILGSSCPAINSFTASPNPQTSGTDGTPNYNTTLSYNYSAATLVRIDGVTVASYSSPVSSNSSQNRTDLPQSIVGTSSPATKTYTLTTFHPTVDGPLTLSRTVTVSVTNDSTPDNYTVPNQNNVEPSTVITIIVGPITGIDMVTGVTGGTGVSVSNNNVNFSSFTTIQNNQNVYVRVTSLPFSTDPSGLTNAASFDVTIGTVQRFFTVTTRAPDVNETFNFVDRDDYVPFPDIDTIPDPDSDIRNQSNEYLISETLLVDDVELGNPNGVEIKLDKPDAQIRVKRFGESTFGSWQNVREI